MLGGSELEEIELPHLDGHKQSRPVRIGNGAATHIQLVCVIYLSRNFGLTACCASNATRRIFMVNCEFGFYLSRYVSCSSVWSRLIEN